MVVAVAMADIPGIPAIFLDEFQALTWLIELMYDFGGELLMLAIVGSLEMKRFFLAALVFPDFRRGISCRTSLKLSGNADAGDDFGSNMASLSVEC